MERYSFKYQINIPIVAIIIFITQYSVFACSCKEEPDTQTAILRADAVFSGKVTNIGMQPSKPELYNRFPFFRYSDTSYLRRVRFQVKEVWKGNVKEQTDIVTFFSGTICGYEFRENHEYLVFAYLTKGDLFTGMCVRTTILSRAQADLRVLGKGRVPARFIVSLILKVMALLIITVFSIIFIYWRKYHNKNSHRKAS